MTFRETLDGATVILLWGAVGVIIILIKARLKGEI
jgi:hypothetical protein